MKAVYLCHTFLACSLLMFSAIAIAEDITLAPLLVTATKTEKDPLDVPFSLTVMSADQLQKKRLNSVKGILENTANVDFSSFSDGSGKDGITIRGIGPIVAPANIEDTSVVVYVDGIPQPLSAIANGYFDLERVEVLKGPQGTLFGRNSTGGAINIVTPTPNAERELSFRVAGGENSHYSVNTVVSGELASHKLYGRLAFSAQNDGTYIDNKIGDDLGDVEKQALRGTLFFVPSHLTDVKFTASAERDRRSYAGLGPRTAEEDDDFVVSINQPNEVDKDAYGLGLTITHDLNFFRFTSATGFNNIDSDLLVGQNGNLTSVFAWNEEHQTISQELRLSSLEDADISWVSGLSFYKSEFDIFYIDTGRTRDNELTTQTRDNELTTESYSWFGEATIPVGHGFNFAAGLRFTHEEKEEDRRYTGNGLPVASASRQHDIRDDFFTGRTSLIYELNPSSRLFANVSLGHKTGGFQRYSSTIAAGSTAKEAFDSSEITTYELGFKHREGALAFDTSFFYNDIKDEQVFSHNFLNGVLTILNVDARSYGVELQGAYQINPAWSLSGNFGYTFSEMRNVSTALSTLEGGANGNELPNTPKFSGGLSLDYRNQAPWLTSNAETFAHVSWQYTDARAGNIRNSFRLRKFNDVDLNIGASFNESLEVFSFVNNVLDNKKEQFGFAFGNAAMVSPGRDRVIGVGLSYSL